NNGLQGANYERYVDAFVSNYSTTIEGIKAKFDPKDPGTWQKALAEMEVGIRVTDLHAELLDQIQASLNKLDAAESALQVTCTNPGDTGGPDNNTSSGTVWDQLKKTQSPEVYGARRTLAVAYQSCDVLKLAPLTSATPSVVGILDYDVRADGGHVRKISSISDLQATDYYIHNQTLAKSSCFNVHNNPLIYNFGGKPYTTTSDETKLDMFTPVNTGGPTLGIDCSAFVFSALTVGGLKLDPDPKKITKASLVSGIPSGAFKEPQINGMRCLQKISVDAKTSILPGDIAAINGHVIMVDAIGADPLAISEIKTLADCTAANINPAKFDFAISQSAPVKNGIGINRHRGADYMSQSSTIRNGFIAYAVAACRAKFGATADLSSPNFSLVRHAKTAECLLPKPLVMAHDDCVAACQPL
ncbi:MAG: hypothetical protein ACXVA9_08405, partial [Bdellovibrionales bacterium]